MECYCCRRAVSLVRRVQLRGDVTAHPPGGFTPDDPAYRAYVENGTYRTAFVCPGCYAALDTPDGRGEIAGRVYNLAGRSRGGQATVYDRAKYDAYRRREADGLGIAEGA